MRKKEYTGFTSQVINELEGRNQNQFITNPSQNPSASPSNNPTALLTRSNVHHRASFSVINSIDSFELPPSSPPSDKPTVVPTLSQQNFQAIRRDLMDRLFKINRTKVQRKIFWKKPYSIINY